MSGNPGQESRLAAASRRSRLQAGLPTCLGALPPLLPARSRPGPRRCRGASLAEYLVALGVGSILLLGVVSLSLYSSRSMTGLVNYVDLEFANRSALDTMTKDIRQAIRVKSYSTNRVVLVDADGNDLAFEYSAPNRELARTKQGVKQVLLRECASLTFTLYRSNPLPGTFTQTRTTDPAASKVVGVQWTCSRKITGSTVNSAPVRSAKIVIRKH